MRSLVLMAIFLLEIFLSLATNYRVPSKTQSFTLGANMVTNPNISTPLIAPSTYRTFVGSIEGWSTKGKFVEYIDATLEAGISDICPVFKGVLPGEQFIDVDSIYKNEQYYQQFNLTAGREFQLSYDWVSECAVLPSSQGLLVSWNGQNITTVYDSSCQLHAETFYLKSINGINEFVFHGLGVEDSQGIMIRNILLQELLYLPPPPPVNFWALNTALTDPAFIRIFTVFSYLKQLPITNWLYKYPAIKMTFQFVFRLALELNHLLLYNYHRMNFTNMSSIILAGVQALDDERGFLLDAYVYPNIGISPSVIAYDQQQTAIPINMNKVVTSYMQRPNGIRLQLADAIFMDFPIIVIIFAFGVAIFRLLYRYRLSLLLRPCSLIGCLLIALLAGKIEVFTFHFLSEALFLINVNFWLKLQATGIIFAYFTVFLFAVASMLLFRAIYGKNLKYMFDFCKYPHSSYMFATFLVVFDVLLGFTHRLLLNFPFFQLCTLIVIEVICLFILLMYIFRCRLSKIGLGLTLCAMNCTRLAFIVTLLIFHISPAYRYNLSIIQQYVFYIMLGLWAISMLIGLIRKLIFITISLLIIWKLRNRRNTVQKANSKQKKVMWPMDRHQQISFHLQGKTQSLKQLMKGISGHNHSLNIHAFQSGELR